MLSLPVAVFLVHLVIYLVNTIGASTVDHLVCSLSVSFSCFLFPFPLVYCPCSVLLRRANFYYVACVDMDSLSGIPFYYV